MAEIVIIGAGPAGLSAALDAAEAGHRCTLVEASGAVGGMAGSFEVAGQRVDYGSHRLHLALGDRHRARFERLLGDDLQVRPRNGRIRLRERWIGFPLRTWDLLTHVPPSFGLRVAAEAVSGPLRRVRVASLDRPFDPSFDAVIRSRLGATVTGEFYGPYARKLYGIEPTELDAELARRRVSASSIGDVLRRVVRAARPAGRQFLYPRLGYGQLSEALAAAAVDAGVDIRLSTPAACIKLAASGVEVPLSNSAAGITPGAGGVVVPLHSQDRQTDEPLKAGTGAKETVHADAVLSTLPIPTLAAIVQPAPPPTVADALARCRTRSIVLVYLAVDRDQYTRFDAHYFPGPDTVVARLSEPKNYRDGDDPAGTTVLCAEIPCWAGDDIWLADDEQAAALAIADLERCGLPAVNPSSFTVRRLPSVYPVFERATMRDRATVAGWLESLTQHRLISFGRQGLAALDNLHHVMDMGSDAASALAPGGDIDADTWLSSLDRFATHVVED